MNVDPQFEEPYGPEALADVEQLERALGTTLPEPYRARALATGFGHDPRRRYFRVKWPPGYDGSSQGEDADIAWVTTFLRPSADANIGIQHSAENAWQAEFGWPRELLPIASSNAGGWVFLGIAGAARGRVYFGYDRDLRDEPPSWSLVAECGADFDRWLGSLMGAESVPEALRF